MKIKPLEWFYNEGLRESGYWRISTINELCSTAFLKIEYAVSESYDNKFTVILNDEKLWSDTFATIEEAKGAAEEHYQAMITKLLEVI